MSTSRLKQLKKLIPPPGHFLVLKPEEVFKKSRAKNESGGRKLNLVEQPSLAKKVYAMYARCHNNATGLLHEARLLYQNQHYARAVALGIAAWEELGKSQIAADYYSGVLLDVDYTEAFKNHRIKTAYLVRTGVIDGSGHFKIGTNPRIGNSLENIRQDALYVSENNDPHEAFAEADAEFIIKRVSKHIEYINYAEELNGRIGSKGLFK